MNFTSVAIIFNPNSTGPSDELAKQLRQKLIKRYPELPVKLKATRYAGHAEKIAYDCAYATKRPLIISSSGDGGYNEVINGAVRAQLKGARPVCAVLAAGNANDHSRTVQNQPLFELIKDGKVSSLDLLKITFTKSGLSQTRYAHSYIGLGLTPVVAVELNKTSLHALNELWIVLKTFYKFRPFRIRHNQKILKLDSILFANIGQMAKVLTVDKNAKPNDGLFEIVTFPHARKLNLLRKLAQASTAGLEQNRRVKHYEFEVLKRMPVQLDGEVQYIDRNSAVTVSAENKILQTLV